jgi:uncharacterized delta-60 repeat protein
VFGCIVAQIHLVICNKRELPMARVKTAFGPIAVKFGELQGARPSATLHRGRRRLRPVAEGLDARTLLSVGLGPTWGFGSGSALIARANTATIPASESINSIAMQNGQVVAVGTVPSGTTNDLLVTRFNTSGSIDTSFGTDGTEMIPPTSDGGFYTAGNAAGIAVQTDGDIDILANASPPSSGLNDFLVVQLTPNGPIDTTFGTSGFQFISFGSSPSTYNQTFAVGMAIGPDGKIVAVGDTSTNGSDNVIGVARLNPNGSLDTSFNGTGTAIVAFHPGGAASTPLDYAYDVVVQPDGRIVLIGNAQVQASGPGSLEWSYAAVARLTTAGTLDPSFNGTGELTYSYNLGGDIYDMADGVTLDGDQIVIVGSTTQRPDASDPTAPELSNLTVTMLNSDGSFDTAFHGNGMEMLPLAPAGIPFNSFAESVVARPSGSLLIGGSVSQRTNNYEGGANFGLLLSLTPTGAPDTSFGNDGMALLTNGVESRMLLQSDGGVFFQSDLELVRVSGPVPAVVSTSMIATGAPKKAQARGVTITFNTAVDPVPASEIKVYLNRSGKRKKAIKVKKVSYDVATSTMTLRFARTVARDGLQVQITPGEIVGVDGEVLFAGAVLPIVIAPRSP